MKTINNNENFEEIVNILRNQNIPSHDHILTRHSKRNTFVNYNEDSLDSYYVKFINDILWQIRHNQVGYIFSEGHIKELLTFEPNLVLNCIDGMIEVSLPRKKMVG